MLTTAQKATLKTFIQNDATLNAMAIAENYEGVAGSLNANASPDFWVYKTSMSKDELVASPSVDNTVFNWTGAGYITRSQGERDAFNAIFNQSGVVNPSIANARQAFTDIFSGTGVALANRTHITASIRRKANRIEKLFATIAAAPPTPSGALGSLTSVAMIAPDSEGAITLQQVSDVMAGL
jgi:hypothetical protein